ncbi:MAG: DUF45 domain-containing protein, partial [Pseudonocardiaceae bacterium]|nr:DUF45 domain-containing protein [Pseudonocardiaceae bacterium]
AHPAEAQWVTNQHDRWGSCTPADRSIRLSARLRELPQWVADYVLVHDLAHLLEPGHGPAFWQLVQRYPKTERARGYLEGVAAGAGLSTTDAEPEGEAAEPASEPALEQQDTAAAACGRDEHGCAAPGAQDALW